jgi:Ca2+-binding EF-hand superfamily protein
MSDPFDTGPEPTGPQYFERGGKQYVRNSNMEEFFNFLMQEIGDQKTRNFIHSLHESWENYGSLSIAQYEKLMEKINARGGPEEAIENAPEGYDYDPDEEYEEDDEEEFYYND